MATAVHHPGHRLAHAAPRVGDQAAPLDLRARLGECGAERVADREIAQVAHVQRLRRVCIPELHRVALSMSEVGERRLRRCHRPPRRPRLFLSNCRAGAAAPRLRRAHGLYPRLTLDPLERIERIAVLPPRRQTRYELQVEALVRAPRRAGSPAGGRPIPASGLPRSSQRDWRSWQAMRWVLSHAPAGARTRINGV